jgi:hypothetical protein
MRLVGSILPPSINSIWAPDEQAKLVLNIESYTQRYSITYFKNQKYFSLFIRASDGMDRRKKRVKNSATLSFQDI